MEAEPVNDALDVLWGWDEIARFLGISCKTAQRMEKKGMPVVRPNNGMVMIRKHYLVSWLEDRG